jgi:hypothetical protein
MNNIDVLVESFFLGLRPNTHQRACALWKLILRKLIICWLEEIISRFYFEEVFFVFLGKSWYKQVAEPSEEVEKNVLSRAIQHLC